MDHLQLTEHLAQAERHVLEGQEHVDRQTALIASLDTRGADTREAKYLLTLFQQLLASYVGSRDRIRRQLELKSKEPN